MTAQLNAAIEAFKNSADKETPSGQYGMTVGKTYTASVSYAGTGPFAGMDAMLQQMVTKYFGTTVELSLREDGTYDVTVYFGGLRRGHRRPHLQRPGRQAVRQQDVHLQRALA